MDLEVNNTFDSSEMICGRSQLPPKLRVYTIFVFLSAFCFPMIIIILSYMELVKSVRSVRHDVIHYGNRGRSGRSDHMLTRFVIWP